MEHPWSRLINEQLSFAKVAPKSAFAFDIFQMKGMSGKRFRLFLNRLIRYFPICPYYLEIGSYTGSTFCSAIFNNTVNATSIDLWRRCAKEEFYKNIEKYKNIESHCIQIDKDFKQVNYKSLEKHNVYFYDACHSEQSQHDAIDLVLPALTDTFVYIADDWNEPQVRNGTMRAIKQNNLAINYSAFIESVYDRNISDVRDSDWHNGYAIMILSK